MTASPGSSRPTSNKVGSSTTGAAVPGSGMGSSAGTRWTDGCRRCASQPDPAPGVFPSAVLGFWFTMGPVPVDSTNSSVVPGDAGCFGPSSSPHAPSTNTMARELARSESATLRSDSPSGPRSVRRHSGVHAAIHDGGPPAARRT
jgi:hypothetical protein